jgi:hypothetical protein
LGKRGQRQGHRGEGKRRERVLVEWTAPHTTASA